MYWDVNPDGEYAMNAAMFKQEFGAQWQELLDDYRNAKGPPPKMHGQPPGATHDFLLHRASGTVHNVNPVGARSMPPFVEGLSQFIPLSGQSGNGGSGGGNGSGGGGSGGNGSGSGSGGSKGKGKGQKGGSKGGGGLKLNLPGPGSIGGPPFLGNVPVGSPGTTGGGSSFLPLMVIAAIVIGGGFLLYHQFHKAANEEKNMDKK